MSIDDMEGNTLIKVSTLWEWAFKLLLVMTPAGFLLLIGFMSWLTLKVLAHDTALARIDGRMESVGSTSVSTTAASVATHITRGGE